MSFLQNLPKTVLVFAVLILGTMLIIYSNPPHTVCTSQKEIFIKTQQGVLYAQNMGKKGNKPPIYRQALELCRNGNSPGACFEWFASVKKLLSELNSLQQECKIEMGEIPEVRTALMDSVEVMVRLAWGTKPPTGLGDRYGWLDLGDIAMFCEIKKYFTEAYGEELWNQKRLQVYQKLPGAYQDKQPLLTSDEIWQKSLFSVACNQIL